MQLTGGDVLCAVACVISSSLGAVCSDCIFKGLSGQAWVLSVLIVSSRACQVSLLNTQLHNLHARCAHHLFFNV